MVAKNLLENLLSQFEIIKEYKLQFVFVMDRINVETVLLDKNQKELFLRGFSHGKDVKISTISDFVDFLKSSAEIIDINSIDIIGENSPGALIGSNINGYYLEKDTKTVVFSWLIDPETTDPDRFCFEG